MGGLFSGLGRSSKNNEQAEPKAGAAEDTQVTDDTNQGDNLPIDNLPIDNRSTTMRLSKNTPSKSEEDFDIPSDTVIPSFSSGVNKNTTSEVRSTAPTAIIGPKITFKGEISGEEDLLIEGTVEGIIELKNNHLTIGKQGSIHADVIAKSITIEGAVEGDLTAAERIGIKASSNVKGNVTADRVTLEDGAKFRGSIDMDGKNSSSKSSKFSGSSNNAQTEKA